MADCAGRCPLSKSSTTLGDLLALKYRTRSMTNKPRANPNRASPTARPATSPKTTSQSYHEVPNRPNITKLHEMTSVAGVTTKNTPDKKCLSEYLL